MQEPTLLYLTCANENEAKIIARTLVDERLIACANILGTMTSVYRWEGDGGGGRGNCRTVENAP